jgi:hypothetical protein
MSHMMNDNDIRDFDPSFSNIERFEAENGFDAFECSGCNDTGYDYSDCGEKVPCDCARGREYLAENWHDYRDDYSDDADALASAGFGTDEDYGFYADDYSDEMGIWD